MQIMKVLGIDPGTRILGWCVVDGDRRTQKFIAGGIYRVGAKKSERGLLKIYDAVSELIEKFSPDILVLESPFFGMNAHTLIRLGEARGAILVAGSHREIPVESVSPAEAKLALTGNGNATKEQVAYMVKNILKPDIELPIDASDAAAVAIAFLHKTASGKRS